MSIKSLNSIGLIINQTQSLGAIGAAESFALLNIEQQKLLLTTKSLTVRQKETILTTSALTKNEAGLLATTWWYLLTCNMRTIIRNYFIIEREEIYLFH